MIRDFISKIFQATLLKWGYGFEPQTDHGTEYRKTLGIKTEKSALLNFPPFLVIISTFASSLM